MFAQCVCDLSKSRLPNLKILFSVCDKNLNASSIYIYYEWKKPNTSVHWMSERKKNKERKLNRCLNCDVIHIAIFVKYVKSGIRNVMFEFSPFFRTVFSSSHSFDCIHSRKKSFFSSLSRILFIFGRRFCTHFVRWRSRWSLDEEKKKKCEILKSRFQLDSLIIFHLMQTYWHAINLD